MTILVPGPLHLSQKPITDNDHKYIFLFLLRMKIILYLFVTVCKYLAVELQGRLDETGKVRGFIETGHGLDAKKKKKTDYRKS